MAKQLRKPASLHPSAFSLSPGDRSFRAASQKHQLFNAQTFSLTAAEFRDQQLGSLEERTTAFPRREPCAEFPGVHSYLDFRFRLEPILREKGIRWLNYGFDGGCLVMNFHTVADAVEAKLSFSEE